MAAENIFPPGGKGNRYFPEILSEAGDSFRANPCQNRWLCIGKGTWGTSQRERVFWKTLPVHGNSASCDTGWHPKLTVALMMYHTVGGRRGHSAINSYCVALVRHTTMKSIRYAWCCDLRCWLADDMFLILNFTETPTGPTQTALVMVLSHSVKPN